jgi:hypothetical protein
MQPNVEAEGLEGKYLLPIAFVYKYSNVVKENGRLPHLTIPHTSNGPETFRYEESNGTVHYCKDKGEYSLTFDEFNRDEVPFGEEEE